MELTGSMIEGVGYALIGLGIVVLYVLGLRRSKRHASSTLKLSPPPIPDEPPALALLEQLGENAALRAEEDRAIRRWLRPIGVFGRLTVYAAIFLALYIFAPDDISHTPLASLTLSDIFKTIAFVALAIVLARSLFNPADDEHVKDAWGWVGVLILVVGAFGLLYVSR